MSIGLSVFYSYKIGSSLPHLINVTGYPAMDVLNALISSLDTCETVTSEVIIVDHSTGFQA